MLAVVKPNIARRIIRDTCIVFTGLLLAGGRDDQQLKKAWVQARFYRDSAIIPIGWGTSAIRNTTVIKVTKA